MKYTKEVLAQAVSMATSMAGVMRSLGVQPSGGLHAHLRRRIQRFGIDTAHFRGQAHNRGGLAYNRLSSDDILVCRPPHSLRAKPAQLRRALCESGLPYACAGCGNNGVWNGRPITLHVDHIDGNFLNCRMENLRFLCPNCHSQTPSYAGRNRGVSAAAVKVS